MSETPSVKKDHAFSAESAPVVAEEAAGVPELEREPAAAMPPALESVLAAGLPLRLRRLELYGFKSFCERTVLEVPDGITAIVGPNGCGKSNLGDALNWVLGEQSAKLLRGDSMQDVIFAGTDRRKPMGLAEVSLHLVARRPEADHEEPVVITRRLFRTGESEYRLNGCRVRLKDIQEFLRAARVGAKTYATIEQGRIEHILNAKPRERRLILEDAAGIAGFKHKRRLAELKMEATRANLLRVQDVIAEVGRQIRSLKRQAARARRYRRLSEALRAKERLLFGLRARELDGTLREGAERAEAAKDAEARAAAALARAEAALEAARRDTEAETLALAEAAKRLQATESRLQGAQERASACRRRAEESEALGERYAAEAQALAAREAALQRELAQQPQSGAPRTAERDACERRVAEASRELERERQRLEVERGRLFACVQQLSEHRNATVAAAHALARLAAQRDRLEGEARGLETQQSALEQRERELEAEASLAQRRAESLAAAQAQIHERTADLRARLEAAREAYREAREAERSAATRLSTLQDLAARFADASEGVRALMREGAAAARGVVADRLQVPENLEAAVEAYLRAWLPAVVFRDREAMLRAATRLKGERVGRAHAVVEGVLRPRRGGVPEVLRRDRRVRACLADAVAVEGEGAAAWTSLLARAVVVEDLADALELWEANPGVDFVTPGGDVLLADGLVIVAGGENEAALLAHQRRVARAHEQHAAALLTVAAAQQNVRELERELEREETEAHQREAEAAALREQQRELRLERERIAAERAAIGRRLGVIAEERAALEEDVARIEVQQRRLAEAEAQAQAEQRRVEASLGSASERVSSAEAALREALESLAAARERLAAKVEQQEAAHRARRSLEAGLEAARRALERAREEAARARAQAAEARTELARTEAQIQADLLERRSLAAEVAQREQTLEERRAAVVALEARVREARGELEMCRARLAETEIGRARAEAARAHLEERCRQELGLSLAEALAALPDPPESPQPERLAEEIATLRRDLERLGPVNMMAIEEYRDLEQRYEFLAAQREDLERSIESLKESIRRINRASRERFEEAFQRIRANFQEVFSVLFRGGRADLRLEEGEDVLEAGVEIVAQPPGKRLVSVPLLSGGEKAMAAIALLFAIFRYQPSPFCLLDEVDAALDDANIGRFTRMLREYSSETQFLLVTHNKLSMEVAHVLYGVTMDEPGVSRVVSLELR